MRDLTCRYDKAARAVYIYIGSTEFRVAAKTVEVGGDDDVMADLDQDGSVIGVEILDVSEPVVKVYDDEPHYLHVETVIPDEEIL